ncbi:MAG TPA: sulfotransferase [Rhodanobacteraceae bacterium]|nr:sulfotransferase [Rhodanobacteraceae bacterium]
MSTPSPNPQRPAWQAAAQIVPALSAQENPGDDARTRDLDVRAQRLLARAQRWLERNDYEYADRALEEALRATPDHPELMRLRAITLHLRKRYAEAVALLRRAAAIRPDDPLIHNNIGSALGEAGDLEGAVEAFRRARDVAPDLAASWYNLGKAEDALLHSEASEAAYARAIALDPTHTPARVLHAKVLETLGRIDEASAQFRDAIARQPDSAEAWAGLIGMKSAPPTAEDLDKLQAQYRRADLDPNARTLIGFAYALALEAHGRYAEAFETTSAANALRRRQLAWDAANASRVFDAIAAAFAEPLPSADASLGSEVIFLVGMPRSGSTLAEQILAAHPDVQGAGELPDLSAVLRDESKRRGVDFPGWVASATAVDWQRLGEDYLRRTAHWRRTRPRSTDKSLTNWQLVGAIRAMLPGAHVVDCRRDPLETCWSALKHQFATELAFTYDVDELASYWRDYEKLMRAWNERYPGKIFRHDYEALVAEPETRIRALLASCGLAFDAACLRFHETERDVRTASAGQVRAPLMLDTARADRYGALLDPLRRALGLSA